MVTSRTSAAGSSMLIWMVLYVPPAIAAGGARSEYFIRVPSLKGNSNATFTVTSEVECATWCTNSERCRGFLHGEGKTDNCDVIFCGGDQTFLPQTPDVAFAVETLTSPVVYLAFEEVDPAWTNHGAQFVMEILPFRGTSRVVKTDRFPQQYLELGDMSVACLTVPETCGATGGSISVWFKFISGQADGGIISSFGEPQSSFSIACDGTNIRYIIDGSGMLYELIITSPTEWVHSVMVFQADSGIIVYHDGILVGQDTTREPRNRSGGNGHMLIGRRKIGGSVGPRYASVYVDEVKMYNRQLSEEEICKMY